MKMTYRRFGSYVGWHAFDDQDNYICFVEKVDRREWCAWKQSEKPGGDDITAVGKTRREAVKRLLEKIGQVK